MRQERAAEGRLAHKDWLEKDPFLMKDGLRWLALKSIGRAIHIKSPGCGRDAAFFEVDAFFAYPEHTSQPDDAFHLPQGVQSSPA